MQTSIEWLIEKLTDYKYLTKDAEHYFEQAKEMHKQEIIDAHNSGFEKSAEGWNGEYGLMDMNNISEEIESEQYYLKTFKKD
jgi:uncharacterized protein with von Willebrand factor type A (vWA) domain